MSRSQGGGLVGVFGGTFNPIHLGHLRAAEEAAEQLGLDEVRFVPCALPPHKGAAERAQLAPAARRLEWVRLAVANNPRFRVDPLEIERGGASYSVETLRALRPRLSGAEPVFLIGSDAFAELGTWREPHALLELAHFAVIVRPPARGGKLKDWVPREIAAELELLPGCERARHRRAGTWVRLVRIAGLAVSASEIRARLRAGRSVRYLLPDAVLDAVRASGAYAAASRE